MSEKTGTTPDYIPSSRQVLAEDLLKESHLLSLLPIAVYICDMSGVIIMFNEQAATLWGRRPVVGDSGKRFCGAFKIYNTDGTYLPHNETPTAAYLKDGLPRNDVRLIFERPDLSRVCVRGNIVPVADKKGNQIGIINCFYEITSLNEPEKELVKKTRELQDYVNNASIALHWVNANGIIKWANKAELDLLGYAPEEYIGHHISEFHVHREKIEDILMRLSCNETLNHYESELRCKDGAIKTVLISSSVYREGGEFIHTRCFTIDITEQKQLFQALKESETRYRNLINILETPLYTTDGEGRITLYNQAAVDLWGRVPEIGKDLWCGSHKILNIDGSDLPLENSPMAVCLKEQRVVYDKEIVVVRPDSSMRHVVAHPQPVFDSTGKLTSAINMLVDITAIKNVEKALRESEARYRNLATSLEEIVKEKTHDLLSKTEELRTSQEHYHKMVAEVEDYAIVLLDRNGIIQNWNKGAEKIKGYKEEEIVGKSFQVFYLPEDRESGLPLKLLKEAAEKGKALHEGWRKRKDNSTFWGSIVLTALHDDQNDIIGFSKVTRDLTERKLAEDKNNEYMAQLEFQNKELEQFSYAASHDMKEPLRKIRMYNDFVANNPNNQLDEKSSEYLNRSINAVERMKNLIEDLLSYSRITSKVESYEEVNLNNVIEEIVLNQKDELDQKGVSIEIDKLPTIHAVPFQMKQLLFNLIDNAIKYKHPDRDARINVSGELVNGYDINEYNTEPDILYYKIAVKDNGVGFDGQYAQKIFEIFQRLNNLAGTNGSGIGLAICKKIVQNHKGFIQAVGKSNEGASFYIYIPKFK